MLVPVKSQNSGLSDALMRLPFSTSPGPVKPRRQVPPYLPISCTGWITSGSSGTRCSTGGSLPALTSSASIGASPSFAGRGASRRTLAPSSSPTRPDSPSTPCAQPRWPGMIANAAAATSAARIERDLRMGPPSLDYVRPHLPSGGHVPAKRPAGLAFVNRSGLCSERSQASELADAITLDGPQWRYAPVPGRVGKCHSYRRLDGGDDGDAG